jgi:lactoylglutathione lyase
MRLNHINLTVTDVPAAAGFLTTYFGLTHQGGNAGMAVLTDTQGYDGMILTLMKARAAAVTYPATFHAGFFIAGRADIDALNARLRDDGFDVAPPAETGHSYGFYVDAPGGFQVEVGA